MSDGGGQRGIREYQSLIRQQEIKGERVINFVRLFLSLLFPLLVLLVIVNNNFQISRGNYIAGIGIILGIVYSLTLFYFLRPGYYHPTIRFISALIETTLITLVIFSGSYDMHASAASVFIVNGYGVYFLFTTLSVLRLSFTASVFSGFVSMLGYLVVIVWGLEQKVFGAIFTNTIGDSVREVRFSLDNEGIKAIFILLSGLISGYGSLRHKRLLLNSIRQNLAVQRINRRLEQTIEERTRELRRRQEELEKDLELARSIQAHLLPASMDHSIAAAATYLYLPYFKVGGDFFDIRRIDSHRFGVLICDVSGHGVGSALIASMARTVYEQNLQRYSDPAAMLTHLNESLMRQISGNFITAFYAIFDTNENNVVFSNAGHPVPYVISENGNMRELKSRGGCIGISRQVSYCNSTFHYQRGDRFFFFTDGVIEVRSRNHRDLFGEARLMEYLASYRMLSRRELLLTLLQLLLDFSGDSILEDDLTALVIDTDRAEALEAITTANFT